MSVRRQKAKQRFQKAAKAPARQYARRQQEEAGPASHRWSPKKGQPVTRGVKPATRTGKHLSTRASLCVLGLRVYQLKFLRPLYLSVKIAQKKVLYSPVDKLVDCLIGMMCGIAGVNAVNTTVRTDRSISMAFGRNGCAEASTIQDTLNECTTENVAQLQRILKEQLHAHGRCTRSDHKGGLLVLDIDFSGVEAGKQAEGSTKGYLSGKKNKHGRQLVRVYASQYDEIVCQWMMPGNTSCNSKGVLQTVMEQAQEVLQQTPAERARTLVRTDAGFGTIENINWLLEQGYQILVKAHQHNHVKKLAGTVVQWEAMRQAGRELGWPTAPHGYVRPTAQLAIRNLKKDEKWEYHLLVSTLLGMSGLQLKRLYDGRGGHPESSFQQDKQGLKLITRQKKNLQAQQMLVGLAQMAHNLLVWAREWPKEAGKQSRFAQWGMLRWVRDLLSIPGTVAFCGEEVHITLAAAHPLSQEFAAAYGELLTGGGGHLSLGEI